MTRSWKTMIRCATCWKTCSTKTRPRVVPKDQRRRPGVSAKEQEPALKNQESMAIKRKEPHMKAMLLLVMFLPSAGAFTSPADLTLKPGKYEIASTWVLEGTSRPSQPARRCIAE